MNAKKAKRIRREVMEIMPAANLSNRLTENTKKPGKTFRDEEGRFVFQNHSPFEWHHTTQRYKYQNAKKTA